MKSYEQYRKELEVEMHNRKLQASEIDDVAGSKPKPLDE